ncbi:MAG: FN3 associated domain-containing protein, partial [Mucilaginibacter sp.]
LLYLWVKANADFKKKVIDLPADDSLRIAASAFVKPSDTEEHYDFAAADENTIKKLSNNYRVISPLAKESPALRVNLYNRSAYTPKALEELSAIKDQVITLNLSKMPVKDEELKTIAQFTNLRHLNLNFTYITGNDLKALAPLKYLESLSLAGSKVSYKNLQQLIVLKSLKQVAVWNTGLTGTEIQELGKVHKGIQFITGFKDDGKPIKLNPPQLKYNSFVIRKSLFSDSLGLRHPIKGVDIRYTTDGSDPDSLSPLFKKGIAFTKNATVKFKAYKSSWLSSDVVSADLFKSAYTADSVNILTTIASAYNNKKSVLIDGQLGGMDANSDKWVGPQGDMEAEVFFNTPVTLSSITFHSIAFPFFGKKPPEVIEVWGGSDKDKTQLLGTVKPQITPGETRVSFLMVIDCKLKPKNITYLEIKTKATAIFLMDELLFN